MGPLQAIQSILPLAFTSGVNLYLTVLVIGLSIRFGLVPDAPASMQVLASLPVLILAGVLYVLEFFADKIQFVDNVWDIIHTFVRPVGAFILSIASLTGMVDPQTEVLAALVASMVALTSHSGKAGTRTAINMTSPAENLTNIVVSLAEDVLVAALVLAALLYPTVANVVTIILLLLVIILVPQALRWSWFTLQAVVARLRAFVRPIAQSEQLPERHATLLPQQPSISVRCQTQHIKGAHGRRGYLSLVGEHLVFTSDRWRDTQAWQVPLQHIVTATVRQRLLVTAIDLVYEDARRKPVPARFIVLCDRMPLVEQIVDRLGPVVVRASPQRNEGVSR
jgi:hypothetical protein